MVYGAFLSPGRPGRTSPRIKRGGKKESKKVSPSGALPAAIPKRPPGSGDAGSTPALNLWEEFNSLALTAPRLRQKMFTAEAAPGPATIKMRDVKGDLTI